MTEVDAIGRMVGAMSPTIHLEDGYQFHIWPNEGTEPPHVHVSKGGAKAKWWLAPVKEDYNRGFNPSQCRRIRDILREHHDMMLERWYERFEKPSDG